MKKSSSNLLLALLAFFLTLLFFLPNLLTGKIPIPADSLLGLYHPFRDLSIDGYNPGKFPVKNPLITDPVLQTYPWRHLVFKNIKEGNFPLWNPYSFSGQPLLANIQSSSFQLTNILFLISPFKIGWAISTILSSVLASLFMFLFLKDIGLSRPASLFGGLILPFSGFFIAWLTWGSIIATVMWLPLILLCLNKIFKTKSIIWLLILTLAVSQIILSGHWQAGSYVFLALVVYLIFLARSHKSLPKLAIVTIYVFLGIVIAAVQILPSLEFINLSARSIDQGYYRERADWFLPIQNLVQLVAPDFFGNPATYNYWGIWNYAEFVAFVGIIPLSLAIYGLIARSTHRNFFIALGLVALIFGLENPISKIPYSLSIPFVSSLQPSRIIFLLIFALTGLASIGFDRFLKEKSTLKIFFGPLIVVLMLLTIVGSTIFAKDLFPKVQTLDPVAIAQRNLILPALTTFALLAITLLRLKIRSLAIILIFAVTIFELFRFGYKFTPFSKLSWIFPQTATTTFLAAQEKPFRVMSTDRRIFHPNIAAVYGIESIDGYDPLYLADWNKFVSVWQSQNPDASYASFNRIVTPQKIDSKFIDLLNVKYILTFDEIEIGNFEKVFTQGSTKIYQNKNVLPRAFFASEIVKVKSDQEEFAMLLDDNFDARKKAISQEFEFSNRQSTAKVSFANYQDQSLTLFAETDRQVPLILTNVYYPGWKAYIDDQQVPIYKVDFMLQSIVVPQGNHEVEFKYQPDSFYNGLYLSLTGVVGTILLSLYLWRRKYQ